MFREDSSRPALPHPIEVSAVALSTLSAFGTQFAWVACWGSRSASAPGARRRRQVPVSARLSYPCASCRASLRDAAGAWPAAVWLALAAVVAIEGGGGASSGGIALGAAVCLGALALAAVATAAGVYVPTLPPRRVQVYVGALALTALASYASIAWSLTPQTSYGDANRWLVAAGAAAAGALLAGLLRRPLESAVWVLCAASLPLVAYAIQQRADGVFFQTSPRLQGVLGYPNAIGAYAALAAPAALWLASSPQRARRVAGSGTLALLVLGLALASSRGGMLAAVIGCAAWFALSDRQDRGRSGRAGGARRDRPGRSLGHRPALLQGARRAVHRARRRQPGLVLGSGGAGGGDPRAARRRAGAARGRARAPHLRPGRRGGARDRGGRGGGQALLGARRPRRRAQPCLEPDLRRRRGRLHRSSELALDEPPQPLVGRGLGRIHRPPAAGQRRRHVRDDRPPRASRLPAGRPGALDLLPRALGPRAAGRDPGSDRARRRRRLRGGGHTPARQRALRRARTGGRRRRVRAAQPDRLGVEAERTDAARLPDPRAHRLRAPAAVSRSRARPAAASRSSPRPSSRSPSSPRRFRC